MKAKQTKKTTNTTNKPARLEACQCACHKAAQNPFSVAVGHITARSITLVDNHNRDRVEMSAQGDEVSIRIYTADEKLALKLCVDELGGLVDLPSTVIGNASTSIRGNGVVTVEDEVKPKRAKAKAKAT